MAGICTSAKEDTSLDHLDPMGNTSPAKRKSSHISTPSHEDQLVSKCQKLADYYHPTAASPTAETVTNGSEDTNGVTPELEENLVHSRIAKLFHKTELFYGDVSIHRRNGPYYVVHFDDGDLEDWDIHEVHMGIKLCKTHIDDTDSSLWDIYNLDPGNLTEQWSLAHREAGGRFLPESFVENAATVVKFYLFLMERQRSWARRVAHRKAFPENWTNDRVLRKYHFCNVYRELDRGTTFFHSQILKLWHKFRSGKNQSRKDWFVHVLWASYCYRLVNKIESFQSGATSSGECDQVPTATFEHIPTMHDWPAFKKLVRKTQNQGKTFFTGAHQTCGFQRFITEVDKVHGNPAVIQEIAEKSHSLKACHKALSANLGGCGDFMSWQILCDLAESNCLTGVDNDDFCVFGKGAKAGILEIFFPGQKSVRLTNGDYLNFGKLLVQHQDIYSCLKPDGCRLNFPYWRGKPLTIKEMEHALCEFSKYQRIERCKKSGRVQIGQRLRKPRIHLDAGSDTLCGACKASSPIGLVACDTCNLSYCARCDTSDRTDISWGCQRCQELSGHTWA